MGQPTQTHPWKSSKAVTNFMATHTEAETLVESQIDEANFYSQGAMIFTGRQVAGDGGKQVIYDTEKT